MQSQSTISKLGETRFRAKIARQHLGDSIFFKNEPTASEFTKILKERLKDTEKTFRKLQKRNIKLSPYLEIGAEYGQACALLETKFNATGIACDISLYSLEKAYDFAKKFNLKAPKTICADAYNLPFKSSSFPFVFIYESLHHFPDPKPILLETRRVLAPGGVCLIGGDPIKQTLQIKLWRRPTRLRTWEKILKFMLILPFISHIGKTEVDYQILEETFSLKVWQDALSIFDKVETYIESPLGLSESLSKKDQKNWLSPKLPVKLSLFLLGGGLQAICFKEGQAPKPPSKLENLLICPDCQLKKHREIPIVKKGQVLSCLSCHLRYKKHHKVLTLLEKNLEKAVLGQNHESFNYHRH